VFLSAAPVALAGDPPLACAKHSRKNKRRERLEHRQIKKPNSNAESCCEFRIAWQPSPRLSRQIPIRMKASKRGLCHEAGGF
jgi:hypothetical protein